MALILGALCFCGLETTAQTNTGNNTLSSQRVAQELQRKDSILNAVKARQRADSLKRIADKLRLEQYRDSLKQARIEIRRQDSIKREELKAAMLEARRIRDSVNAAKKAELQRAIAEKKRISDSIKVVRKARTDSIVAARAEAKRIRDQLKKYKNSRKYKDSVASVRKARTDSIRSARAKLLAEKKATQKQRLDSLRAAREAATAKLKAEQKRKLDSTKLARQQYMDSVKSAQKIANELLKNRRKRILDSTKLAMTKYNDSLKTARKKYTDSLVASRKAYKDSLAKVNDKNDKEKKKKKSLAQIQKEKARQIHQRKQGSWTNEKLLKKKWSMPRRIYQNTVSRYNSYYNAKLKYDAALDKLSKRHKDIYSDRINLHPYNLDGAIAVVGSEMDTVVKKCAYDTQIHDPRSKWFDNVYLLMGQAFFFKNDYDRAITAFQYVINEYKTDRKQKRKGDNPSTLNNLKFDGKNKIKLANMEKRNGLKTMAHHSVRNDALIWLIRTYIFAEQYPEAQSLISILKEDSSFPDRLKDELYFAEAELNIEQGNGLGAMEPLKNALAQKDINKVAKQRGNFLLAQLYAEDGNVVESNKFFNQALQENLPLEMEYFTQLNLASNILKGAGDKTKTLEALERIAKAEKYAAWRGETYLTLGKILAKEDPTLAVTYLQKSIAQTESDESVKAQAFEKLGSIYFDQAKYALAKPIYDSAILNGQASNPPLANMAEVQLRKTVLSDLVKYTTIISTEDSLQSLSKKSRKEQLLVINAELKRRRKAERKKRQEEANKLSSVALTPGSFGKKAWYFYNNAVVQQGLVEFEAKWGKRPLVDNWRRSNSNASNNNTANNDTGTGGEAANGANSTETQKMLNALYTKEKQFEESDEKIVDAYYQLALIYSSRLGDYQKSVNTSESLIRRFSDNQYLSSTYYGLYLNYNKLNQPAQANKYKALLLNEFPETQFAQIISKPDFVSNAGDQALAMAVYDSTYQQFIAADYNRSLKQAIAAKKQYPENELMAKFDLIEAKSLAGLKLYDTAIKATKRIISTYPGTEESIHASDFLKYLRVKNTLKPGVKLATDNTNKVKANTLSKNTSSGAVYTYKPNAPHLLLIYLKQIDGSTMGLKAGFSDLNAMRYADKKYKTNMNLLDRKTAVISVEKFSNAKKANDYRKLALKEKMLYRNLSPNQYDIAIISEENFRELLRTRKIRDYLKFFNKKYN